jgi:hypothetical protein
MKWNFRAGTHFAHCRSIQPKILFRELIISERAFLSEVREQSKNVISSGALISLVCRVECIEIDLLGEARDAAFRR